MAMHMMDIAQNSIRAGAANILIDFYENTVEETLTFRVEDDGVGMDEEKISKLTDPFYTTRETREVGLGVPFLKMTCEQAGGCLDVFSEIDKGTVIEAKYMTNNPDCLPLGDIAGYLTMLLKANPDIHFIFRYRIDKMLFKLDTEELIELEIELNQPGMTALLKSFITGNLTDVYTNRSAKSYIC